MKSADRTTTSVPASEPSAASALEASREMVKELRLEKAECGEVVEELLQQKEECSEAVEALRMENETLRDSSAAFGELAERLNQTLKHERTKKDCL
jgi:hypothetical protein